ncbi:adenosylcobinamide-GDP ribazoletransferase, partial [Streptomyces sp. NPDC059853]|uniref:adenosylcobinamide-GDP ribazoletransferase n=1 Tax=Streptomyces sp. NPDC059853 TaxID=3346973 RepID=UPI00364A062B
AAVPATLLAGPVGGGAAVLGLAAAEVLLARCRRRLGGVTGDVLGALAETAGTTALLVATLGTG